MRAAAMELSRLPFCSCVVEMKERRVAKVWNGEIEQAAQEIVFEIAQPASSPPHALLSLPRLLLEGGYKFCLLDPRSRDHPTQRFSVSAARLATRN